MGCIRDPKGHEQSLKVSNIYIYFKIYLCSRVHAHTHTHTPPHSLSKEGKFVKV